MKILFFSESLRAGGKERRLVELIKGLQKFGNIETTLVLTEKRVHYTDIFNTRIKLHYIVRKGLKKDPRLFWQFYKIAKEFKPDIIHVWGNMVAFYAIPTKMLLNIPMLNNQVVDAPDKVKAFGLNHKVTFFFSDKIIANSYAGLKSYNVPHDKSAVIYNGFDFHRVVGVEDPKIIRRRYEIKTPYVVGMVASFSSLKDYGTYIKAASIVLENRDDVTFLCVGAGDSSKYQKMVQDKFRRRILFLGPSRKIENIMNICDIGVLVTNIKLHGEGISNALIEFSALSKPIIATNNGGTPELIENGKTGFLVEPFNPFDLSQKINILLNNEKMRFEMGGAGKRKVKQKFNINQMILEFYKLYESYK